MPAPDPVPRTEHGSCVAIGAAGVLIRGPSGAGKSMLALRLILDAPRALPPAILVADDRVLITEQAGRLIASPPALLAGLIEVRGLGIRRLPHQPAVPLSFVVDLVGPEPDGPAPFARMPEPDAEAAVIKGHSLRRICAPDSATGALLLAALLASGDHEN